MRRLEACKDILKWETIPAITLNLESILAGEFSENEFRKQFTASERAAIGEAIEKELGNRKGANQHTRNCADPQGETVDIAARKAGFTSRETFERAKTVVERGAPEVIRAMDAGEVSISAAATPDSGICREGRSDEAESRGGDAQSGDSATAHYDQGGDGGNEHRAAQPVGLAFGRRARRDGRGEGPSDRLCASARARTAEAIATSARIPETPR
jgi:hypothetical protein